MFDQGFGVELSLAKGLLLPTQPNSFTHVFALSPTATLMLLFSQERFRILNASRSATDWCLGFRQVFWKVDALVITQILSRSGI